MAIFEKENEVFQNSSYREHLNRNWDNGNKQFDAMNARINAKSENSAPDEVVQARIDANGQKYASLAGRLDANQKVAENAKNVANNAYNYARNQLENKIAQMNNGVKGYPNAEAIKKAYPAGADGIYIAVDTGHQWYYVDGMWKDAGVYQATGITEEITNTLANTYKFSKVINKDNYLIELPNLDDLVESQILLLQFERGETNLPAGLPFTVFPYGNVTLINNGRNKSQIIVTSNGIYSRSYNQILYKYDQWYDISGMISSNENISDLTLYKKAGDLPIGKLFAVLPGVFSDLPNSVDSFSIITMGARSYSRDGLIQLAYNRNGNSYWRSTKKDNTWGEWQEKINSNTTETLRNDAVLDLGMQNKIWQKYDFKNVVMDKWISSSGSIEDYNGWCYTPNFIPVGKNLIYTFAARDSDHLDYTVMPMSDVYICLYDKDRKFIKQIYTTRASGTFNVGDSAYMRFSMSYKKYQDVYYPSLYQQSSLPSKIEPGIYTTNPQTDGEIVVNSINKYDLVPTTTIFKASNLPLYLYGDSVIVGDANNSVKLYLYDTYSNTIKKNNLKNGWVIPKNDSSDYNLEFFGLKGRATNSYWNYPTDVMKRRSLIKVKTVSQEIADGKNISVLVIGDSLTNYNIYMNRVGELFKNDSHTKVSFLGTRGDETKHEGRGGWSAKTYCTMENYNTYDNPFLYDGKFDFKHYMKTEGYANVDLVIINLGTNDVNTTDIVKDYNFEESINSYKKIIANIKNFNPNVQIALGSTLTPARYLDENLDIKTRRQEWNEKVQRLCAENGYTYIPYSLVVDPINDFKFENVQIDEYNSEIIKKVSDNTHPANSGYIKMGDLTYATIKYIADRFL